MNVLLKVLAVLLMLAGLPLFLASGTLLGTLWVLGPPSGDRDEVITKVFMLHAAFSLSGLLAAAGGVLWAVTRIAYQPLTRETTARELRPLKPESGKF